MGAVTRVQIDAFVRGVGRASDRQIELALRGPVRRAVYGQIFRVMPSRLDRAAAAGLGLLIEFRIARPGGKGEPDVYQAEIAEGRCRTWRGSRKPAGLTVETTAPAFIRLAAGAANPVELYMAGKVKLKGDLMLGARLSSLFKVPSRRRDEPKEARGQTA